MTEVNEEFFREFYSNLESQVVNSSAEEANAYLAELKREAAERFDNGDPELDAALVLLLWTFEEGHEAFGREKDHAKLRALGEKAFEIWKAQQQ